MSEIRTQPLIDTWEDELIALAKPVLPKGYKILPEITPGKDHDDDKALEKAAQQRGGNCVFVSYQILQATQQMAQTYQTSGLITVWIFSGKRRGWDGVHGVIETLFAAFTVGSNQIIYSEVTPVKRESGLYLGTLEVKVNKVFNADTVRKV